MAYGESRASSSVDPHFHYRTKKPHPESPEAVFSGWPDGLSDIWGAYRRGL